MLRVVTFRWKPASGYRSQFGPETINVLRRMVARNYRGPHEFVAITDDPKGIDPGIRVVPLWDDFSRLKSPHGEAYPSCYRRLKIFSAEAEQIIGPRFVCLDLDTVVTGDLSPLWDRDDDFMIWGDTAIGTPYNGSMILMNAGARRQVWDKFDPVESPKASLKMGYIGSDQAWIGTVLGKGEKIWRATDGVYSYRNEIQRRGGLLPANARIVFFHGNSDPWTHTTQARHAWVKKHYR